MQKSQVIQKLIGLKKIKPREEWASLLKSQILAEQTAESVHVQFSFADVVSSFKFQVSSFFFARKYAYAFATILLVAIGVLGFAQSTLPGDTLFQVKKITEQSQAALMGTDSLKNSVDNFKRRSQDLAKAARDNRTSNMPSAINEVRASISDVAKSIAQNSSKDSQTIKDIAVIVAEIKSLENSKTLGDLAGTTEIKELNDALAPLVMREINDLEKTTLTEEQQKTLSEIKDLYEKENYSEALEKILLINEQ